MAPVSLKYVVSFSSQDNSHPVTNLTNSDGFKKWLSDPKDKSGQIEAIFQLEQSCEISYIDIGLIWCAMVEIQVGRSDWPQGKDYQTLVPTASVMNVVECRTGNNTVRTRMFGKANFNETVSTETWDRVRVICRQPWRKDIQYGISFIRIKSDKTSAMDKNDGNSEGAAQKSVKSIKKHFFGKTSSGENKNELVSKLLKIAGSSEDGTEQVGSLSRTAKLVIAAKDTAKKNMCPTAEDVSPSSRQALYSNSLVSKYGPKFEEEISDFLATYEIKPTDLDKITIADIRHKFEKTKKRKLTPEEKKTFIELTREYICLMFTEGEESKADESTDERNTIATKSEKKKTARTEKRQSEDCKTTPKHYKNSGAEEEKTPSKLTLHTPSKPSKLSCMSEQKKAEVKNAALAFKSNGFKSPGSAGKKLDVMAQSDLSGEGILKTKIVSNFGPSFTHISPKGRISTPSKRTTDVFDGSPSTDDMWLSAKSPLKTSPSPGVSLRGRGRKRSVSGGGARAKIPRMEKDIHTPTANGKVTGRGTVSSREITPTSFERCASCQESVPGDQLVSHTLICRGTSAIHPDVDYNRSFPGVGNILGNGLIRQQSWEYDPSPDVYITSTSSTGHSEYADQYVECPLCNEFFRQCVVERHAAQCGT